MPARPVGRSPCRLQPATKRKASFRWALVPAAMVMLLKALAFVHRSGIAVVDDAVLIRASRVFADTMLARLGITKAAVANLMVDALARDPDPMRPLLH